MGSDRSGISMSFGVSKGDEPEEDEKRVFRVVAIAQLVPGSDWGTGRVPPLDPIPVDATTFDAVMSQLAPSLRIEVADPFGAGAPALPIDLVWKDRKAMRPNEIVAQVPALRALAEAARVVQDVAARRKTADAARAELARMLPRAAWADALVSEVRAAPAATSTSAAATPAAAAPAPVTGLDALLDLVDVSAAAAPPPAAEPSRAPVGSVSRIVAAVAASARAGLAQAPKALVGTAPERLAQAFRALLSSILRHPEVRRLERAWRGLRLLVEHADKRAGVEVDLVCATRDQVSDALSHLASGGAARAPVDLVVVDEVLEPSAVDLERLATWASHAEALLAPVIVGGTAGMVGARSLADIARSTGSLSTSDDARAVATRAVSAREASRWVAVVLNDPLVRAPYNTSSSRQAEPAFDEDPGDPGANVHAHGGFVVAALAAKSFVKNGWPTALTGPRDGAIGGLAVRPIDDHGAELAIPLEVLPSEDAVRELARAGMTMLSCAPNSDTAMVVRAPVLHRATGGSGAPTATLADQLFVGRFARAVQQVASAIPAGADPKAAAQVAQIALAELFAPGSPAGPEILATVDPARGALTVTVHPRRFAGISIEEVTLGAALG